MKHLVIQRLRKEPRVRSFLMQLALVIGTGLLSAVAADFTPIPGELLPTGARITPAAAPGAVFQPLNPDLPGRPEFIVGQAVATAISPVSQRSLVADIDLRPGKIDPAQQGTPGGAYPFWVVIKGDRKAYVSSQRDREVVVLNLNQTTEDWHSLVQR